MLSPTAAFPHSRGLRRIIAILALALLYLAITLLSASLFASGEYAPIFWPVAGLALSAVIIGGPWLGLGVLLGAAAAGIVRLGVSSASAFATIAIEASGATVQALVGAHLLRRLAELHGGSVAVESEVGTGSRFTVTLPYQPDNAPPPVDVPAISPADGGEFAALRSAMVIEDSATVGEQLARYLAELDIRAIIHSHGVDAVEHVISARPDVVFLDLQLPDQSGWQILERLKSDPLLREIPIVIVSVVDDRNRGLQAGAAEYLAKPASRDELRRALLSVVAPQAVPDAAPQPAGARILLAEDNEMNIIAIGDYLRDRGYHLTIARNGREALEQAQETKPELILMDVQMPEVDGLEAIQRLRTLPEFAATPIIALTALAMPGDRERCLAAGASTYMTKPVSLRGLVQTIEQILNHV